MTVSAPATHPGLLRVNRAGASGDFASSLSVLKSVSAGQTLCPIQGTTLSHKAYTSVQVRPESAKGLSPHIELNSDLVFANHSCDPSVAFQVPADQSKWAVVALKDLEPGDHITFFYPSTEWEMDQPFDCNCGSARCLGRITGAKDLPFEALNQYQLNDHIRDLKKQQLAAPARTA